MRQWIKTISTGICVLTILLHLVPQGKFSRYVRFYAGLLFFLMAFRPVLGMLSGENALDQLIQLEALKEDYYNLELTIEGMEELKNNAIKQAYQKEIQRQIDALVVSYGGSNGQADVEFEETDEYLIKEVLIKVKNNETASMQEVCKEIAQVYSLEPKKIKLLSED